MIDWKRKLTSRRFWISIAEFVSMLIIALHGTQETATQVTALILAGAGVVAYVIGEGLVDAAGAAAPTNHVILPGFEADDTEDDEEEPEEAE